MVVIHRALKRPIAHFYLESPHLVVKVSMLLDHDDDAHTLAAVSVTEVKTCKDDFTCPSGFLNLGDIECLGKCDKRECCEKGECIAEEIPPISRRWR